jgi:hypothetical protein
MVITAQTLKEQRSPSSSADEQHTKMIISAQAVHDQTPSSSAVESSGSEALTSNSSVVEARLELLPMKISPNCESRAATNQHYGERGKAALAFLTEGKKPPPNFPPAPLDNICLEPGWADGLFDFDIRSPFSEKGTTAVKTKAEAAPEKRKVIFLHTTILSSEYAKEHISNYNFIFFIPRSITPTTNLPPKKSQQPKRN